MRFEDINRVQFGARSHNPRQTTIKKIQEQDLNTGSRNVIYIGSSDKVKRNVNIYIEAVREAKL